MKKRRLKSRPKIFRRHAAGLCFTQNRIMPFRLGVLPGYDRNIIKAIDPTFFNCNAKMPFQKAVTLLHINPTML